MRNCKYVKLCFFLCFFICLTACTKKDETKRENYVSEKVFDEDFDDSDGIAAWFEGTSDYTLSNEKLIVRNIVTREITEINIEFGDRQPIEGVQDFVDENGAIHILCYKNSGSNSDMCQYTLSVFDFEGKLIKETDLTEVLHKAIESNERKEIILLPNGKLIVFYYDGDFQQLILSADGTIHSQIAKGQISINNVHLTNDGVVLIRETHLSEKYDGKHDINEKDMETSISRIDTETGEWTTCIRNFREKGFVSFVINQLNESIYYRSDTDICVYDGEKGESRSLISFSEVGLDPMDVGWVIYLPDDVFYVLSYTDAGRSNYFKLVKGEASGNTKELENKKELILAVIELEGAYRDEVYAYNRLQNNVKISIVNYNDVEHLLADIMIGKVPDFIDLSQADVYTELVKKNLLEDLGEYLEKDNEVSKADFLEKALQMYQNDGKIYAVPYALEIIAMMGDGQYLKGIESWDFNAFKSFIKNVPDPQMVTGYVAEDEMLYYFMEQYIEDFVNLENKTCDFHVDSFKNILECAAEFGDNSIEISSENDMLELYKRMLNGDIVLTTEDFYGITPYAIQRSLFPNGGKIIGFPAARGDGICILPSPLALAMVATGINKDEAWDFEKYILTHQKHSLEYMDFVSYKPLLSDIFEEARYAAEIKETAAYIPFGEGTMEVPSATEGELEDLLGLIDRGTVHNVLYEKIIEIICDEAGLYFSGDKGIEEMAEVIQNRVTLYLNEK